MEEDPQLMDAIRAGFAKDSANREQARQSLFQNPVSIEAGTGAIMQGTEDGKFIVGRAPDV